MERLIAEAEKTAWRQILNVGGRSPLECLHFCWGLNPCEIETRVQRAGLFMRLLNSPIGSWEHSALLLQKSLSTPWFTATLEDIRLVYPGVHIHIGEGWTSTFLFSTCYWSDEGDWCSLQPYGFPLDFLGRRHRQKYDEATSRSLHQHIQHVSTRLRQVLRRARHKEIFEKFPASASSNPHGKTCLLAAHLCKQGPPWSSALDWVAPPSHRMALCAFVC
eukprot:10070349-Karenia_brevis.AAC.1